MGEFYKNNTTLDNKKLPKLTWWQRKPLFSSWLLVIAFGDVLLIVGSTLKLFLEYNVRLRINS